MNRGTYGLRLFSEFVQFARARRAFWIVPLVLILAVAAAFIVTGQSAAPLIYTLF